MVRNSYTNQHVQMDPSICDALTAYFEPKVGICIGILIAQLCKLNLFEFCKT